MGVALTILIVAGAVVFRFLLLASVIGWLPERWRQWFFGEPRSRHA